MPVFAANENALPQNYMKEKYGLSEPFYCDLEDPVEEIACMAWDGALGASYGQPEKFQYLVALASINLSQQILSSGRYNLYINKLKKPQPLGNQIELCVVEKHGLCGNHRWLTEKILNFAGIKTRDVGIFYEYNGIRSSHNTVEFYVDGKWRYADPTWGAIWLENADDLASILSLEELLKLSEEQKISKRIHNKIDPWLWYGRVHTFEYLNADNYLAITFDHEGVFNINLNNPKRLANLPHFLGSKTGKNSGYGIKIMTGKSQPEEVLLSIVKKRGCAENAGVVEDNLGNLYEFQEGKNIIKVTDGTILTIKNKPHEICYFQFKDISFIN